MGALVKCPLVLNYPHQMMHKEIFFTVPEDEVEAFSDTLTELGALSITIECLEGREIIKDEAQFSAEYWEQNQIIALIDAEDESLFAHLSPKNVQQVPEIDWVLEMQKNTPIQVIGDRLWIVPSWHQVPPEAQEVLFLDPKNAFGTGDHPTTHLCLEWLVHNPPRGKVVIDYGCGSGILMIAAKKLGACRVMAYDIDPGSMLVARQNCSENQVDSDFSLTGEAADLVMANIHLGPLLTLVQTLRGLCKPKGTLVLSGLLPFQLPTLLDAYLPHFELLTVDTMNGWMRVVLRG
ncbi:MAG: 50S ribosomal protein L11 methyltransferase [Chlamydiia bacterium]